METAAWLASTLVLLAFFMRTMIPLRIVAIASNVAFIVYTLCGLHYGIFAKIFPIFVLHALLLPLNIFRLYEMKRLVTKIREASTKELAVESLLPYMKKETFEEGGVLFRKGDAAEKVYFLQTGSVTIPEIRKALTAGAVFGEVGIFTPSRTRSASAICGKTSVIYSIRKEEVLRLYYQNPKFGFVIVRLLSRYAKENVDAIVEFQQTLPPALPREIGAR